MASVKVAVRVRPFNKRENDLHSSCIVEVEDKKTRLINNKIHAGEGAESRERVKDFTFDYSYWSHRDEDKHFAPQVQIYEDLGTDVVSNALQGYNACVFAYGQTGSGKTFTMMGSQNNPGLIPRICEALFSSMAEGREAGTTYKVEVSYLEIYNERVKDLLRPGAHNDTHSLRVREHPKLGPYVQDLSTHLVHHYPDIQELMRRGNAHRTTASTHMNDTSSRSHAIFTVTFIQAKLQSDTPLETRSKIHLVDLAGSERADATGATGQRLKEGAHINKSLVTLGSVISALAEQAARTTGKTVFIPYRDSVLTWLLKDSLGGNSKTIMIATISPADVNYGETLSTLRYANRAKNIINKPTINEDPNVKLIRELREEILNLKNMLHESGIVGPEASSEKGSIMATLTQKQAKEKELTDQWTERWSETHTILQEQKTLGLRKAGHGVVLDSERPHLVLIDDNLLTTGVTLYHLNDGTTTIGSLPSQDIRLEGGEVLEEHCTIDLHEGEATLESLPDAQCWVNSQFVDKSSRLTQGCVVVLGGSHMFRYNDPQEAARLRKEGNKTHLNLSRLSFLSRSTTDLVRSYDNLSGMESDSEKVHPDVSNVSRVGKMTRLSETADLCEMSTQTSLHTHSQPTSPVGSHLGEGLANNALRKSSLTLPLVSEKEDPGGGISCNSTPASDTFYTATSVLSPDVRDLSSPWSPLPLDGSNSGKEKEESKKDACGAFAQGNRDLLPKVPKEDDGVVIEENVSHFERDDDLCSSVYKSPSASSTEVVPRTTEICDSENVIGGNQNFTPGGKVKNINQRTLDHDFACDSLNLIGITTSPILHTEDHLYPQGSPGVDVAATSTPIKVKDAQGIRKERYKVSMQLVEDNTEHHPGSGSCEGNRNKFAEAYSASYVTNSSDSNGQGNVYNIETNTNNNFRTSGNGNTEVYKPLIHETGKEVDNRVERANSRENVRIMGDGDESSMWHSGLEDVCKTSSVLISPHLEAAKAAEMLLRLRENADKSNASIDEQIRELEALKQHYSNLEDQLVSQPSVVSKKTGIKTYASCDAASGLQENQDGMQGVDRPMDLPLDSTLLQEDRLALLIEREVQRRVFEEVVARENAALCSRSQYRRTYRSMSASVDPWSLSGVRVLTPSEVRPYTSMSAGYEMEGEGGNHLYQSATSADDLLLTPGPLQSPMTDYDMSCGICVCIPGYEMRGAGSAAHWEYEVKLAAGPDSWTVFRRYRRFRELHMYMCHKYGQPVDELYFPPRRLFGNFTERVVAERRGQLEQAIHDDDNDFESLMSRRKKGLFALPLLLQEAPHLIRLDSLEVILLVTNPLEYYFLLEQIYLQQLIVLCSELDESPLCGAPPCRATLAHFSPFFQRGVFETSRHTTS